jgi:ribonuclease HI
MADKFFYAVKVGRQPGVYRSWDEAAKQVLGVSGAVHKKFPTAESAQQWLVGQHAAKPLVTPTKKLPRVALKKIPRIPPLTELHGVPRIYTDGACRFNGSAMARAGVGVYVAKNDPRNVSRRLRPGEYRQTNQTSEIVAALIAVRIAHEMEGPVAIVTDSKYVVGAMLVWRAAWIACGWRTTLVNKDLLRELSDAVDARLPRQTHFVWVKGHSITEGNIQADRLATAGADRDE